MLEIYHKMFDSFICIEELLGLVIVVAASIEQILIGEIVRNAVVFPENSIFFE